jgi:hypothetical protein
LSDRPSTGSGDRISVARDIGGAHLEGVGAAEKPVYVFGDTQALKATVPSLHSEVEFRSEGKRR